MVFIDLDKTYDKVPREPLWKWWEKRGVPVAYIRVIKDIYDGLRARVRILVGDMNDFPIDIGLHQGSALSPFLFTIIMDELTSEIQDEISWCMLFVNDIVLIDETRERVNTNLERWRDALEVKGFKLSRSKIEYLHCRFSAGEGGAADEVAIGGAVIARVERFRYLGSIIQENGKIDEDIDQ